ncbi:MAG: putative anti-sigma regulatory factor, serine/threonine protein kinase, partial [Frankiales bacterium]|nr:putative anti-sigma regulatory factor, serine/threonine protein kinase [Frankiales bacterium]
MDAQRLQMSSARAVLPSAPASAAVARRLVGEACAAADASAFTDTAALLTSELVTNAVVHARSDLEVLVETCRDGLRVEVRDRDDRMPERREYDAEASTGRGALLVEALADAYGAEPLSYGGKAVWFSLGSPPPWEHHPAPKTPPSVVAEPVPVLLCGLPVALFRAWQQQT